MCLSFQDTGDERWIITTERIITTEQDSGSGPGRLPRGPHGLSREEVRESQRARLLLGATEAVAEHGYASASVAHILKRAGVSRTTFYELFDDKADCFLAAWRMGAEVITARLAEELARMEADGAAPLEKLDGLLTVYLHTLADNPTLSRVFLVEVYAAGPRAIGQRRDALESFIDLVAETHRGSQGLLGTEPGQRITAEVLVDAVSSKVTTAVGLGEAATLRTLQEPMMRFAARILEAGGAVAAQPDPPQEPR